MYGWELQTSVDLLRGPMPDHPDRPPREGYAHHLEEAMEWVHAFAHRQLHLASVKIKRRCDHSS